MTSARPPPFVTPVPTVRKIKSVPFYSDHAIPRRTVAAPVFEDVVLVSAVPHLVPPRKVLYVSDPVPVVGRYP
jgi:hypothetical protein